MTWLYTRPERTCGKPFAANKKLAFNYTVTKHSDFRVLYSVTDNSLLLILHIVIGMYIAFLELLK